MAKVLYCASVWVHLKNFHLPYIREMEDAGWEVHVAASGIPEDTDLARIHNLPVKKNIFSPQNLHAIFRLIKLIRNERFDLIYVHTTLAAFLCRIALLLSGVPTRLVYCCHGYFFGTNKNLRSRLYLLCEKLVAGVTSVLVLMNREDYDSAIRYNLGKNIRFSHGMGIVPERYTVANNKSGDEVVFLCVGELSARKNQEQLLRAFALAHKETPNSVLWLAGDGLKRWDCENLAKELNISQHVRFLGHVQDVSALYSAVDVLVSASRCEGLPFCVMEALHFGLPSILSDIKGHRDLIQHGRSGMLYDLGDESALAKYITALGFSREERERMSALAKLPEEYLIEATIEEFRQIIGLPVPIPAPAPAPISV